MLTVGLLTRGSMLISVFPAVRKTASDALENSSPHTVAGAVGFRLSPLRSHFPKGGPETVRAGVIG